MARRSEQGNVLGFVLVGALLVALLLGGIYVARNSMGQLATNNGSSAPDATDGVSDKDTEPANGAVNKDTANDKTDEQRLKEALEAQSAAEKKAREQQAANNNSAGTTAKDGATSAASSASHLPATGPEEVVVPAAGAMLLSGAALSYVRSRRLI